MADMFDRVVFDSVIFDTGAAESGYLGGGYVNPYLKYKEERDKKKLAEEISELKEAVKIVVIERENLEAKLSAQNDLKGRRVLALEAELIRLAAEALRLEETMRVLQALMVQWDNEDALAVLSMSSMSIDDVNSIASAVARYMLLINQGRK